MPTGSPGLGTRAARRVRAAGESGLFYGSRLKPSRRYEGNVIWNGG